MKGFMYSLWSGQLLVYEGEVVKTVSMDDDLGRFDGKTKSFMCSIRPGVVCNSVVWLDERDDEKAKIILINYEEFQISILREKLFVIRIKLKF